MTEKSIPQQVYDEFIENLAKVQSIGEDTAKELKSLIESGDMKKKELEDSIVKLLQKGDKKNEDPRT